MLNPVVHLAKPKYEELSFRQVLLADAETMSYNAKWGGTIAFSPDRWDNWYAVWVEHPDRRFYRYLYSLEDAAFVGEAAFHFDNDFQCYICSIIVKNCYRRRGLGRAGLTLLLDAAKNMGVSVIYDNIAVGNGAIRLFRQCGFTEKWKNNDYIMLEKILSL